MRQAQQLARGCRRLLAQQGGEVGVLEGAKHGAQPVGAFRVPGAGVVGEAGLVGE